MINREYTSVAELVQVRLAEADFPTYYPKEHSLSLKEEANDCYQRNSNQPARAGQVEELLEECMKELGYERHFEPRFRWCSNQLQDAGWKRIRKP